jgi:hypothetical protein
LGKCGITPKLKELNNRDMSDAYDKVKDLELNSIDMRSYFNGLIGIYKNN